MVGKAYTMSEMKEIVVYILEKKVFDETKGRRMWEDFANSGRTQRTWQSLKETFLKRILPDIHNPYYKLKPDEITSFRTGFDVTTYAPKNKLKLRSSESPAPGKNSHSSDSEKPSTSGTQNKGSDWKSTKSNNEGVWKSTKANDQGTSLVFKRLNTPKDKENGKKHNDSTETVVLDDDDAICNDSEEVVKRLDDSNEDNSGHEVSQPSVKSARDCITYSEPLTPMMQAILEDFDTDSTPNLSDSDRSLRIVTDEDVKIDFNKSSEKDSKKNNKKIKTDKKYTKSQEHNTKSLENHSKSQENHASNQDRSTRHGDSNKTNIIPVNQEPIAKEKNAGKSQDFSKSHNKTHDSVSKSDAKLAIRQEERKTDKYSTRNQETTAKTQDEKTNLTNGSINKSDTIIPNNQEALVSDTNTRNLRKNEDKNSSQPNEIETTIPNNQAADKTSAAHQDKTLKSSTQNEESENVLKRVTRKAAKLEENMMKEGQNLEESPNTYSDKTKESPLKDNVSQSTTNSTDTFIPNNQEGLKEITSQSFGKIQSKNVIMLGTKKTKKITLKRKSKAELLQTEEKKSKKMTTTPLSSLEEGNPSKNDTLEAVSFENDSQSFGDIGTTPEERNDEAINNKNDATFNVNKTSKPSPIEVEAIKENTQSNENNLAEKQVSKSDTVISINDTDASKKIDEVSSEKNQNSDDTINKKEVNKENISENIKKQAVLIEKKHKSDVVIKKRVAKTIKNAKTLNNQDDLDIDTPDKPSTSKANTTYKSDPITEILTESQLLATSSDSETTPSLTNPCLQSVSLYTQVEPELVKIHSKMKKSDNTVLLLDSHDSDSESSKEIDKAGPQKVNALVKQHSKALAKVFGFSNGKGKFRDKVKRISNTERRSQFNRQSRESNSSMNSSESSKWMSGSGDEWVTPPPTKRASNKVKPPASGSLHTLSDGMQAVFYKDRFYPIIGVTKNRSYYTKYTFSPSDDEDEVPAHSQDSVNSESLNNINYWKRQFLKQKQKMDDLYKLVSSLKRPDKLPEVRDTPSPIIKSKLVLNNRPVQENTIETNNTDKQLLVSNDGCQKNKSPQSSPRIKALPSPSTKNAQPSQSSTSKDIVPSPSTSNKDVQQSPSKKDGQPIPSTSNKDLQPSMSNKEVQPCPSISNKDVQPCPSISNKDVQPIPSTSNKDVQPSPSTSNKDVEPSTTNKDIQQSPSTSNKDVEASTTIKDVQPSPSTSNKDVQPSPSTSNKDVQPSTGNRDIQPSPSTSDKNETSSSIIEQKKDGRMQIKLCKDEKAITLEGNWDSLSKILDKVMKCLDEPSSPSADKPAQDIKPTIAGKRTESRLNTPINLEDYEEDVHERVTKMEEEIFKSILELDKANGVDKTEATEEKNVTSSVKRRGRPKKNKDLETTTAAEVLRNSPKKKPQTSDKISPAVRDRKSTTTKETAEPEKTEKPTEEVILLHAEDSESDTDIILKDNKPDLEPTGTPEGMNNTNQSGTRKKKRSIAQILEDDITESHTKKPSTLKRKRVKPKSEETVDKIDSEQNLIKKPRGRKRLKENTEAEEQLENPPKKSTKSEDLIKLNSDYESEQNSTEFLYKINTRRHENYYSPDQSISGLSFRSIESTQGYQDSDYSPINIRILRRRKIILPNIAYRNRKRLLPRFKTTPKRRTTTGQSFGFVDFEKRRLSCSEENSLRSSMYKSESYQCLMPKMDKLKQINETESIPDSDDSVDLSPPDQNMTAEGPVDNSSFSSKNTTIDKGSVNIGSYANESINLSPPNQSMSQILPINNSLPGLDVDVTENNVEESYTEFANSSNVSLPQSPEISMVENIRFNASSIVKNINLYSTFNDIQSNTDTSANVTLRKSKVQKMSIVSSKLDASCPLMEQELTIIPIQNSSAESMEISESQTGSIATKTNNTVTDSLLCRINNVDLQDGQTLSESIQEGLNEIQIDSTKKATKPVKKTKDNLRPMSDSQIEIGKDKLKRCSTPKRRKARKSHQPSIETVVEEVTIYCSGRKSCPPNIQPRFAVVIGITEKEPDNQNVISQSVETNRKPFENVIEENMQSNSHNAKQSLVQKCKAVKTQKGKVREDKGNASHVTETIQIQKESNLRKATTTRKTYFQKASRNNKMNIEALVNNSANDHNKDTNNSNETSTEHVKETKFTNNVDNKKGTKAQTTKKPRAIPKKAPVIKIKITKPKSRTKYTETTSKQRKSKIICESHSDSGINDIESIISMHKSDHDIKNKSIDLIHNHSDTCLRTMECFGESNNSIIFIEPNNSIITLDDSVIESNMEKMKYPLSVLQKEDTLAEGQGSDVLENYVTSLLNVPKGNSFESDGHGHSKGPVSNMIERYLLRSGQSRGHYKGSDVLENSLSPPECEVIRGMTLPENLHDFSEDAQDNVISGCIQEEPTSSTESIRSFKTTDFFTQETTFRASQNTSTITITGSSLITEDSEPILDLYNINEDPSDALDNFNNYNRFQKEFATDSEGNCYSHEHGHKFQHDAVTDLENNCYSNEHSNRFQQDKVPEKENNSLAVEDSNRFQQNESSLRAKYWSYLANIFPITVSVPNLSTITESSRDNEESGKATFSEPKDQNYNFET